MLIGKIISISDIRVNIFRLEDVDVKIGDVLEAKVGDKSYEFEVAEINNNEIVCMALKLHYLHQFHQVLNFYYLYSFFELNQLLYHL